ncbi:MAG: hypothetical protein AB7F35_15485 [Acetobacteraceae bacterium]
MNDPRIVGPLSAVAVPIADELAKYQALPPDRKAGNYAYAGRLTSQQTWWHRYAYLRPEADAINLRGVAS